MASQGETYVRFVEAELKAEHERRTSLDSRAAAVTTTSSAFIALAGALTVLVTGKDYAFSDGGARGVMLSAASLLLAALIACVAAASRRYEVTKGQTLEKMFTEHWTDTEVTARFTSGWLNVKTIKSLRTGNNRKAGQLIVAHALQVSGIAGLIVTLAWELRAQVL